MISRAYEAAIADITPQTPISDTTITGCDDVNHVIREFDDIWIDHAIRETRVKVRQELQSWCDRFVPRSEIVEILEAKITDIDEYASCINIIRTYENQINVYVQKYATDEKPVNNDKLLRWIQMLDLKMNSTLFGLTSHPPAIKEVSLMISKLMKIAISHVKEKIEASSLTDLVTCVPLILSFSDENTIQSCCDSVRLCFNYNIAQLVNTPISSVLESYQEDCKIFYCKGLLNTHDQLQRMASYVAAACTENDIDRVRKSESVNLATAIISILEEVRSTISRLQDATLTSASSLDYYSMLADALAAGLGKHPTVMLDVIWSLLNMPSSESIDDILILRLFDSVSEFVINLGKAVTGHRAVRCECEYSLYENGNDDRKLGEIISAALRVGVCVGILKRLDGNRWAGCVTRLIGELGTTLHSVLDFVDFTLSPEARATCGVDVCLSGLLYCRMLHQPLRDSFDLIDQSGQLEGEKFVSHLSDALSLYIKKNCDNSTTRKIKELEELIHIFQELVPTCQFRIIDGPAASRQLHISQLKLEFRHSQVSDDEWKACRKALFDSLQYAFSPFGEIKKVTDYYDERLDILRDASKEITSYFKVIDGDLNKSSPISEKSRRHQELKPTNSQFLNNAHNLNLVACGIERHKQSDSSGCTVDRLAPADGSLWRSVVRSGNEHDAVCSSKELSESRDRCVLSASDLYDPVHITESDNPLWNRELKKAVREASELNNDVVIGNLEDGKPGSRTPGPADDESCDGLLAQSAASVNDLPVLPYGHTISSELGERACKVSREVVAVEPEVPVELADCLAIQDSVLSSSADRLTVLDNDNPDEGRQRICSGCEFGYEHHSALCTLLSLPIGSSLKHHKESSGTALRIIEQQYGCEAEAKKREQVYQRKVVLEFSTRMSSRDKIQGDELVVIQDEVAPTYYGTFVSGDTSANALHGVSRPVEVGVELWAVGLNPQAENALQVEANITDGSEAAVHSARSQDTSLNCVDNRPSNHSETSWYNKRARSISPDTHARAEQHDVGLNVQHTCMMRSQGELIICSEMESENEHENCGLRDSSADEGVVGAARFDSSEFLDGMPNTDEITAGPSTSIYRRGAAVVSAFSKAVLSVSKSVDIRIDDKMSEMRLRVLSQTRRDPSFTVNTEEISDLSEPNFSDVSEGEIASILRENSNAGADGSRTAFPKSSPCVSHGDGDNVHDMNFRSSSGEVERLDPELSPLTKNDLQLLNEMIENPLNDSIDYCQMLKEYGELK